MLRRTTWLGVVIAVLATRLISMAWVPLIDTSEPRYAEIARYMAVTGDWITPWLAPGTPFWGKPPFMFWSSAVSLNALGATAFAARLPAWLAGVATLMLIAALGRQFFKPRVGRLAVLIYLSSALAYVCTGAVLTDPYLALASTGAMVCYSMAQRHRDWRWGYGFFLFLALGVLAKGPLVLALCFGALGLWLLLEIPQHRGHAFSKVLSGIPWVGGILLMLLVSGPWYWFAEQKTPGFLHYFIVGEHILRYLDPGWSGDLYGKAHQHVKGTIWVYMLLAAFPWSLLALGMLVRSLRRGSIKTLVSRMDSTSRYLLAWTLFPPVFFSIAGNILWTYALPALAPFCLLLARAIDHGWETDRETGPEATAPTVRSPRWMPAAVFLVPATALVATLVLHGHPLWLKTQAGLVKTAEQRMTKADRLAYVDEFPYSAQFYSEGTAGRIDASQLTELLPIKSADVSLSSGTSAIPPSRVTDVGQETPTSTAPHAESHSGLLYLAVPRDQFESLPRQRSLPRIYQSKDFVLTVVPLPTGYSALVRGDAMSEGNPNG